MKVVEFPQAKASLSANASIKVELTKMLTDDDLEGVFILKKYPDGWGWRFVGMAGTGDLIGHMELAKIELVEAFFKNKQNATSDS